LRKYPSLWTRSYFVESVGNISEKTVVAKAWCEALVASLDKDAKENAA